MIKMLLRDGRQVTWDWTQIAPGVLVRKHGDGLNIEARFSPFLFEGQDLDTVWNECWQIVVREAGGEPQNVEVE